MQKFKVNKIWNQMIKFLFFCFEIRKNNNSLNSIDWNCDKIFFFWGGLRWTGLKFRFQRPKNNFLRRQFLDETCSRYSCFCCLLNDTSTKPFLKRQNQIKGIIITFQMNRLSTDNTLRRSYVEFRMKNGNNILLLTTNPKKSEHTRA